MGRTTERLSLAGNIYNVHSLVFNTSEVALSHTLDVEVFRREITLRASVTAAGSNTLREISAS